MKNMSDLLSTGNLSPKERVRLQMKNYVESEKTGKSPLSDSDMYALGEGWRPKHKHELYSYNKYLYAARKESQMRNDIEFRNTQVHLKISRVSRVLDYAMFSGYKSNNSQKLDLLEPTISRSGAFDFIVNNSGFNYEYAVENNPKIKVELDRLIKQGVLCLHSYKDKIIESERIIKLITGRSILNLPDNNTIKVEYLKQIEHYIYFSQVLLFIKQSDLFKFYGELLAIKDIYQNLISIFEVDLDYFLDDTIEELEKSLSEINIEILYFLSKVSNEQINKNTHPDFSLDVCINGILFNLPEKNTDGDLYVKYNKIFKGILGLEYNY